MLDMALAIMRGERHGDDHDQSDHGNWARGGGGDALPPAVREPGAGAQANVGEWLKDRGWGTPADLEANARATFEQASATQREVGIRWYEEAHGLAREIASRHGISVEHAAGVIAAMSPNSSWETNQQNARDIVAMVTAPTFTLERDALGARYGVAMKMAKEESGAERARAIAKADALYALLKPWVGTRPTDDVPTSVLARTVRMQQYTDNVEKAVEIIRGRHPRETLWDFEQRGPRNGPKETVPTDSGLKVRSFYSNIIDPRGSDEVTVDTHIMRALTGDMAISPKDSGAVSGNSARYTVFRESILKIARERGIRPHQVQAIIWTVVNDATDIRDVGGWAVDAKDYALEDGTPAPDIDLLIEMAFRGYSEAEARAILGRQSGTKALLDIMRGARHLPGEHDQLEHGNWAGGGTDRIARNEEEPASASAATQFLRKHTTPDTTASERRALARYIEGIYQERDLRVLDAMIARTPPLEESITVHRGGGLGPESAFSLGDAPAGTRLTVDAFVSTTMSAILATVYGRRMEITIPAGARVMAALTTHPERHDAQYELILPRGLTFEKTGSHDVTTPSWAGIPLSEPSNSTFTETISEFRVMPDAKAQKSLDDALDILSGERFNPNHDEQGRFAEGPGGGAIGVSREPGVVLEGTYRVTRDPNEARWIAPNGNLIAPLPGKSIEHFETAIDMLGMTPDEDYSGGIPELLDAGWIRMSTAGLAGILAVEFRQPLTPGQMRAIRSAMRTLGDQGVIYDSPSGSGQADTFGKFALVATDVSLRARKALLDILSGERFNPNHDEQGRFAEGPGGIGSALEDAAEQRYGTTDDWRKAGFVLADGRMLDFSEGTDKRTLDHGDVQDLPGVSGTDNWLGISDFMQQTGAVRLMPESPGLSFHGKLTEPQIAVLVKVMEDEQDAGRDTFYVDRWGTQGAGTPSEYTGVIDSHTFFQPEALARYLRDPDWTPVPSLTAGFRDALAIMRGERHGEHDQLDHGNWARGGGGSVTGPNDDTVEFVAMGRGYVRTPKNWAERVPININDNSRKLIAVREDAEARLRAALAQYPPQAIGGLTRIWVMTPEDMPARIPGAGGEDVLGLTSSRDGASNIYLSTDIFTPVAIERLAKLDDRFYGPHAAERVTFNWVLAHEVAHHWAAMRFGSTQMLAKMVTNFAGSRAAATFKEMQDVTDYGKNGGPAEAFAEAVGLYVATGRVPGPLTADLFRALGVDKDFKPITSSAVKAAVAIMAGLAEWDESLHPRDESGKFTTSGGGGGWPETRVQNWRGLTIVPGDIAQRIPIHFSDVDDVTKVIARDAVREVLQQWSPAALYNIDYVAVVAPHEMSSVAVAVPGRFSETTLGVTGTYNTDMDGHERGDSMVYINSALFSESRMADLIRESGREQGPALTEQTTVSWIINHELGHHFLEDWALERATEGRSRFVVMEEHFGREALAEMKAITDYGAKGGMMEAAAEAIGLYMSTGRMAGPATADAFKRMGLLEVTHAAKEPATAEAGRRLPDAGGSARGVRSREGEGAVSEAVAEAVAILRGLRHTPGGDDHDQSDHGNWARGGGTTPEPLTTFGDRISRSGTQFHELRADAQRATRWERRNIVSDATREEREAVSRYIEGYAFALNGYLRSGRETELERSMQGDIARLDALMARARTSSDQTGYRFAADARAEHFPVGARFRDKGFVSMSLLEDVTDEYRMARAEAPLFRIEVPKGSRALPALTAHPDGIDSHHELILGRGTTFEVVSHETREVPHFGFAPSPPNRIYPPPSDREWQRLGVTKRSIVTLRVVQ